MVQDKIKSLVAHFGSKSEICRQLGIERQNITQWERCGIPPIQAVKLEMITNGKFKAVDLLELSNDE